MLHLIDFKLFVRTLVIAAIVTSTAIYYIIQLVATDYAAYEIVFMSSLISTAIAFVLTAPVVYRYIWKYLRKFKITALQDLNGVWSGTIQPTNSKPIEVRAIIRQTLYSTEIDVHGETVKSVTLSASPMVEAGQHKMYYVYRAEPKEPTWSPYTGTTRLTLRVLESNDDCPLVLSGQYFTDRDTKGTIELRQTGLDPTKDAAFY